MTNYKMLTDYVHFALESARFENLEDGTVAACIPVCEGIMALGTDTSECRDHLQVTLESWILLALKLGHVLPIIHGINLNQEPVYEGSVD